MAGDDPDALPQSRASDQDRDDALQQLAAAAGDGRLTLEEYSSRADLALAAGTQKELDGVLADLQTAAAPPADTPEVLTAIRVLRRSRFRPGPFWAASPSSGPR